MAGNLNDLLNRDLGNAAVNESPKQAVEAPMTASAEPMNDDARVTVAIGQRTGTALQARINELHQGYLADQQKRIANAKSNSKSPAYVNALKVDRTQKKLNNVKLVYFAAHDALRESGYTDANFEKYILEALDEKLTRDLNSHLADK